MTPIQRKPRRTASYAGPEVEAISIPNFAKRMNLGINTAYDLVNSGEVRSFTLGRQRRIATEEVARLKRGRAKSA